MSHLTQLPNSGRCYLLGSRPLWLSYGDTLLIPQGQRQRQSPQGLDPIPETQASYREILGGNCTGGYVLKVICTLAAEHWQWCSLVSTARTGAGWWSRRDQPAVLFSHFRWTIVFSRLDSYISHHLEGRDRLSLLPH